MEEFFSTYHKELLSTGLTLTVLFLLRFLSKTTIKRIGRLSNIAKARTKLITKFVMLGLSFLTIGVLVFIWGVNFREIGLLFSSVFAVIGVALFAQWSILSNITAGVILFFAFPFKIGDHIRIFDKEAIVAADNEPDVFIIEDIKAFHVRLRSSKGNLVTYPNSLMLQKAITLVTSQADS